MRKGPIPKCKFCGKKIETDDPYIRIITSKSGKERKEFYCNKSEYLKFLSSKDAKKCKDINTDRVYNLSCEIIGRSKIINTIFWKEKKVWNEIAEDKIIADYLEENKFDLANSLDRIDNVEFNRIRYLSAIIKNNIANYVQKIPTEPVKTGRLEYYDDSYHCQRKRRSLEELEDIL